MIQHAQFVDFMNQTYGTTTAILVRDPNPSSPTGLRPWRKQDTDTFAEWLASQQRPDPNQLTPIAINVAQAGKIAGVGTKTVRSWLRRSHNPLPHFREGRRCIIILSCLKEWLTQESLNSDN